MADKPGQGIVDAISGAVTGKNVMDTAKKAWNRVTGKSDDDDEGTADEKDLAAQMNKASADARVKRANDAFAAQGQKISTQTAAQKRPAVKAKVTVVSKPAAARKK